MTILILLSIMIASVLIQHLGLANSISNIIDKIASCSQCFTFWFSLACLLYLGYGVIEIVVLSILMSYLSNWFVLLLMFLQRKFTYYYGKEKRERRNGKHFRSSN